MKRCYCLVENAVLPQRFSFRLRYRFVEKISCYFYLQKAGQKFGIENCLRENGRPVTPFPTIQDPSLGAEDRAVLLSQRCLRKWWLQPSPTLILLIANKHYCILSYISLSLLSYHCHCLRLLPNALSLNPICLLSFRF